MSPFRANTEITVLMSSSWPPANTATLHDTEAQFEFPHWCRRVKLFAVTRRNPHSTFIVLQDPSKHQTLS